MEQEDTKGGDLMIPQTPGAALAHGTRAGTLATAFQGLIPTSIGEAYALAGYLAKSSAIPVFYRGKPDTILTVILAGLEIGLTPIRSLNNLTNISGNLGMKADLQLALVRRSGLLDYYDEGFELRGKTDPDLENRTADGAKILALVKAVPDGKPYGWATARRKGDREGQVTTRTFTWTDAETAEIWEKDEDGGERKRTKLSAKFNYVAFPADMYPKRARGRVLQITHSDVLAGMLSTEALEGGQVQVIDVDSEPAGDSLFDLLAAIDSPTQLAIVTGFDALEFSPARRLQKLVEYKGRPIDLATWLRDEYSQRAGKGKGGTARKAKAAADVIDAAGQAAPGAAVAAPDPGTRPAPTSVPDANTDPAPGPSAGESLAATLDGKFPALVTPAAKPTGAAERSAKAADAAAKFRKAFGQGGLTL